jgi:prophage regulatory protein
MRMSENILSMAEAVKRTSLTRQTIYALMAKGEFPESRKLTGKRIGFLESEVTAWMENLQRTKGGGNG